MYNELQQRETLIASSWSKLSHLVKDQDHSRQLLFYAFDLGDIEMQVKQDISI